jgi:hypothetical protein
VKTYFTKGACDESEFSRCGDAIEHERLDGLAKRLCASSYFRTQVNFMTQHQLKDNVRNCCVTLSLRAMITDVRDTVEAVVGRDATVQPMIVEKMKGAGWSQGFKFHLMRYVEHEFVGVTNWCTGEAFLPILGDFRVFGIQIGRLAGTLSEQVAAFSALSGNEVLHMCDIHYASGDTDSRGLLMIPEGYIFTLVCKHGIALQWGFGCNDVELKSATLKVVSQLLTCWPHLDAGDWKEWHKWLSANVEVADA